MSNDIKEYRVSFQGKIALNFMSMNVYAKSPKEAVVDFCKLNRISNEDRLNSKIYVKRIDNI